MKKFRNWEGMPEFDCYNECERSMANLEFIFDTPEDFKVFQDKIGFTFDLPSVWYPKLQKTDYGKIRYTSDFAPEHCPKYPIYIVSKGRWEKRLTSDSLIRMNCKHYMVVEESQYETYKDHVDANFVTLLILPQEYLDNYDTCDDLGTSKSKGPGAARNFAWDHSKNNGFTRHWVMDDNMRHFYRMNGSKRVIVSSGAIFRAMEDHADRFTNVYMSGPHYRFFGVPSASSRPFAMNTRIYSCNLIKNDIPYRWRGRWNEDTILSLDILKDGHVTLQYYAFLTGKVVTQAMKGGNTEEFYSKEGTLPKSQMLKDIYPDVTEVLWRYGRWHHYVDYSRFKKNRLEPVKELVVMSGNYEYGMKLEYV